MKFLFVDEKGNAGDTEWFWLVGLSLDEDAVAKFPDLIYEPFSGIEEAWLRRETLKILRLDGRYSRSERREMSDRLYNHLGDSIDYTIFSVGMHQSEYDELQGPAEIYKFAFTMLIERFDWYLDRVAGQEYGCVFVDVTSQIPRIQEEHEKIRRIGSGHKDIDYVITIGAPIKDKYSPGIQLADLIVSGVEAHFVGGYSYFYDNYYLPHMYRRPGTDVIQSYGVKIHPESSYDELEYHPNQLNFS